MGCKNVPCGKCPLLATAAESPLGCAPLPLPTVVACGGILKRAFNSSLHGCPPELELSTSDTPLSAGLGGNEPLMRKEKNGFPGKH